MSKQPAYQTIKNAILADIHQGLWRAGQAIPTEIALAQQFGVSRMTVNRALKELTDEQVLERRQGSGTFVTQKQFSHTFVTVHNIRHDIEAMGRRYHAKMIKRTRPDHAKLPLSAQMVMEANQMVCQVDIIHYGDDVPLQFERRFVDLAIVPAFYEQDFNVMSTSDYLISQVPLVRGRYFIEAAPCPPDIADALQCQVNSPALHLFRYTYSGDKVVTFVQMWHGQGYRFEGELG